MLTIVYYRNELEIEIEIVVKRVYPDTRKVPAGTDRTARDCAYLRPCQFPFIELPFMIVEGVGSFVWKSELMIHFEFKRYEAINCN